MAAILKRLAKEVAPGVSAAELDKLAFELIKIGGPRGAGADEKGRKDTPAFLGYQPDGATRPFPGSICVSVNDEIVHGIPSAEKIFKTGDIVSIDMGLVHAGLITDAAVTVVVGESEDGRKRGVKEFKKARALIKATREALDKAIAAARPGAHVGDIGEAVESFVRPLGFGLAEELAGHGVGYAVHEDPYVPNTGRRGEGAILKPGMVIAIEPMLTEGGDAVIFDRKDGYTVRTKDGSCAAHFEHTIAIAENGAEILTK